MELESRRNWLFAALSAAFTMTIGVAFYPVIRFLWPRKATVSGAQEVVAPFLVKQLVKAQQPFNFGGKPCLVFLTPEGQKRLSAGSPVQAEEHVRAFSGLCTHVDCTVVYRPGAGDIFCNCHDGVYDLQGRNVSGPPPRPLESFKVTLRGDTPGEEEIIVSRET